MYLAISGNIGSGVNRAFATLEWRASRRWLFNAGAMVEDNSLTGTSLAPRAFIRIMARLVTACQHSRREYRTQHP